MKNLLEKFLKIKFNIAAFQNLPVVSRPVQVIL
jgi:hypothetical protein